MILPGGLYVSSASGSGLYLYEITPASRERDRLRDASTLMTHPAGMARLPDRMITRGLQAFYGDTPCSLAGDTVAQRKSPGNTIGWFPGASLFYHQRLTDDFSAGIGLYDHYGLGLDFDE